MNQIGTLLLAVIFSIGAYAAESKTFNQKEFDQAVQSGKPVIVQVHADWCPTCKKQDASLKEILTPKAFADVVLFKADYDKDTDLKKQIKVSSQSTLVFFNKGKEVARSQGVTDKSELKKALTTQFGM